MRALTDASLIDAMRAGVPEAWAEFDARFRPLLERYATRVGIPRWEWSVCITEVLDDEALRLVERAGQLPQHLTAYLVRAVRSRFLELKRASLRRDRRYAQAAAADTEILMSEHARRSSDPPRIAEERSDDRTPATRFARTLSAHLSTDEQQMLAWVAEGVPQRMIAEWSGISREAAKKRIARLCRRLRAAAPAAAAGLPSAERREIDRLLRRASAPMNPHSGASDDG
jgi:DNA-directed RNA polymerase specialized sigma24 family protein